MHPVIPVFNFFSAGEAFLSKQFLASFNLVFMDLWLKHMGHRGTGDERGF
jgi:hypothetical protein